MRKFSLLLSCILIAACTSFAQVNQFHYRSAINGISSEGWYAVPLPSQVFSSVRPDFSDLRIYQLNGNDTTEAPYLLKVRTDVFNEEIVELPMINKSTRDGKLYVTFELKKGQQVNWLDLGTDAPNFNAYVLVEGSADQREWFALDSLQRILSIQKDGVDFRATTINFPATNYPFLRLRIDADHPIRVVTAAFKKLEIKKGNYHAAEVRLKSSSSRKTKQTVLDASFTTLQPVSTVRIDADDAVDFYRPMVIESLTDSAKTPKGWTYSYETVYNGYIISGTDMKFEFPYVLARKLRITVYNDDNTPISIRTVSAEGPQIELIARLTPGENYLYYGNPSVYAPSYDVVHFENKIPVSVPEATLGDRQNRQEAVKKGSPLFESTTWLWGVMGLIILVLGYFTLKMMKNKA